MKFLSRLQLCLFAAFYLLAAAQAQKKGDKGEKGDKKGSSRGASFAGATCGGRFASGCTVMVGLQVVPITDEVTGSVSAFGRTTFQFDPAFTEMKYSIQIQDENNDPLTTSDVLGVYLVCGRAGEELTLDEITNSSRVASLQFNSRGSQLGGQFLSNSDLNTDFISCGVDGEIDAAGNDFRLSLPNIASVYSAMKEGLLSVVAETQSKFSDGVAREFIRGQIFLPQDGYSQSVASS